MLNSVDGTLDENELAFIAGMSVEEVGEMLERLAMIGVVDLSEASAEPAASHSPDANNSPDGIDLSSEERVEIDHLSNHLGSSDYYLLLGVERTARPAEIKKSYYKLAPRYHPDRYFGKDLGPYKQKIEAIFAALTKAHDTLRYPKRRATYDAALPPLRPGDRVRQSLHPAHVLEPEPEPVSEPPAARTSRPGAPVSDPGARPSTPGARPSSPGSVPPGGELPPDRESAPEVNRVSSVPRRRRRFTGRRHAQTPAQRDPEVERVQREVLARKLAGAKARNIVKTGRHASEARTTKLEDGTFKQAKEVRRSAAEMFRDRYAKLADTAKQKRLEKYLTQGEAAMESGDYRVAAAAFQQALKLSPDDAEVQEKLETATSMALRQ